MTAIGSISLGNHRVLVGDLALSNDPKYYSSIRRIPTRQNHSDFYPPDSPIIVLELMQKIYFINKDIVLAWCGEISSASKVVERLDYEFKDKLFDKNEYKKMTIDLEKEVDFRNIGLLVHFKEGERYGCVGKNVLAVANEFDDVPNYFCGSGEDELIRLNNLAMTQGIREPNSYLCALFSHIISADLYAPSYTLGKLFGGGMEAVVKREEGFVKYGGFTILIWEAIFENKNCDGITCTKILKQYYHNDMLFIKEIVLDFNEEQPFWLHVVGNILQESKEEDAKFDKHSDLFSEKQLNFIYLIDIDKGIFKSKIIAGFGKDEHLVEIEFDMKGEISFSLNKERMNQLMINLKRSGDEYYNMKN